MVSEKLEVKLTEKEELRVERNFSKASWPWVHRMKISSMNRHQKSGFRVSFVRKFSSRWPINRLAYAGAMRVPILVPDICKYVFSLKEKAFLVRTNVDSFMRKSVEGK